MSNNNDEVISYVDIPIRMLNNGVISKITGFNYVYSLDDTVSGQMLLINKNDTAGFHLYVGNSPPIYFWNVFNTLGERCYSSCGDVGCSVYNKTLLPGDSLERSIVWNQNHMQGFKVFSGIYKIEGNYIGNTAFWYTDLVKWIKINELGNPLSTGTNRDYEAVDSLKVDFLIRNRISNNYTLNFSENSFFYCMFVSGTDTLVYKKINMFSMFGTDLEIKAKSDMLFFSLAIPNEARELKDFQKRFNVLFLLNCVGKQIKESRSCYLR